MSTTRESRCCSRIRITRGLGALERGAAQTQEPGPYLLQASIAACHARAPSADATDWKRIAALYGELARVTPSPVVELNRAIAISRDEGPAAGLALLDALHEGGALERYPYLPAARADLLERLGRREETAAEFDRAAALAENTTQRGRLLARARPLR